MASVKPDGTFTLRNVPPVAFEVDVTGSTATYLKPIPSGQLQGAPLTLRLANDFGTLEGTVKNEFGDVVPHVRVTPIGTGSSFSQSALTDAKGHFQIAKMPPGDYQVFAWDYLPAGAALDPDFRKPYEKLARAIRLSSSGHETLDLVLIHVVER